MLSGVTSYLTGSQQPKALDRNNPENLLEDQRVRLRETQKKLQQIKENLIAAVDKLRADEPLSTFKESEVEEATEDLDIPDGKADGAKPLLKVTEFKSDPEAEIKKQAEWMKQKDQWALKLPTALEHFLDGKNIGLLDAAVIEASKKTDLFYLAKCADVFIFNLTGLVNGGLRFILFCRSNQEKFALANSVSPGDEFESTVYDQTQQRWAELERILHKCFVTLDKVQLMLNKAVQPQQVVSHRRQRSAHLNLSIHTDPARLSGPNSLVNSPRERPHAPSPAEGVTLLGGPALSREHSR